jgi:transposase-like protein
MKTKRKLRRTFSTAFKKEKVELLDRGQITVRELSDIYEVSETAIYKWKKKFSCISQGERVVIEKISEGAKNRELLKRVAELERIVGQKQLELDYYRTAIDILSEEEGEDLLKKYKPKP